MQNRFMCPHRKVEFSIGQRCHWFEYSHDQIIVDGGNGTIIEFLKEPFGFIIILCDDGKLRQIYSMDIDPDIEEV